MAHSYYPPHLWRNAERIVINKNPVPGHARQPEGEVKLEDRIGETYAPALMIAQAERFIAANAGRPFLLDLSEDPGESRNLADARPDLIARALKILRCEVSENAVFPLRIPE